jgi:hypothetical protein
VRLEFSLRLDNDQPVSFSGMAESGKTVTFDVTQELSAEALPTRYADGTTFVLLRFFQRDRSLSLPLATLGMHAEVIEGSRLIGARRITTETTLHGKRNHQIAVDLKAVPVLEPRRLPDPTA